jgi:hypothetical protein
LLIHQKIAATCPKDATFVTFTAVQQAKVLESHNTRRTMISTGQLAGFAAAKNMKMVVRFGIICEPQTCLLTYDSELGLLFVPDI